MNHRRLGKSFTFPGGAFASSVNTEDIFVLCASSSISDELRDRFQAEAPVEIRNVATFCARIEAALPPSTTFRAQRVRYLCSAIMSSEAHAALPIDTRDASRRESVWR